MQRTTLNKLAQRLAYFGMTSITAALVINSNLGPAQAQFTPQESLTLDEQLQLTVPELTDPVLDQDTSLSQTALDRFLIRFDDAYLVYEPGDPGLQIAAQRNVLSYGWDWEVVELKPYLYAFRQANWQDFYWKVNTSRQEVYRVSNGTFGELGGDHELLEMGVRNVGSPEAPERFFLEFTDAYLVRASSGVLQIAAQSNVLSYGGDWSVVELEPDLFQLKQSVWQDFYWQVDTSQQVAERVNGGTFGQLGDGMVEDLAVTVEAVYQTALDLSF